MFDAMLVGLRKLVIKKGWGDARQEMKLLTLIFTKHPKSSEAWAHRLTLPPLPPLNQINAIHTLANAVSHFATAQTGDGC